MMQVYPPDAPATLGFDVVRGGIAAHLFTAAGADHLDSEEPADTADEIRRRLQRASEFLELRAAKTAMPFVHLEDVRPLLARLGPVNASLEGEEIWAVGQHLNIARTMRSFLVSRSDAAPALANLAGRLEPNKTLEDQLHAVVDEKGNVRETASRELMRLRKRLLTAEKSLRDELQRQLRDAVHQGYATEGQPTLRNGRMVIPVRAEAKRKVKGFVQDASASGQTVFIEPVTCLELNNELHEIEAAVRAEEIRILRETSQRIRACAAVIEQNQDVIASLDVIHAKARFGLAFDGVVPEVGPDLPLVLRNARNPALLVHFRERDGDGERAVVPLDIDLGGGDRSLVVTGPNAGGKTVALKTVGILALMVAHGIPVPVAVSSQFPVFRKLFVDIGDAQSIEQDLSTFSAHAAKLAAVVSDADDESLVLIDEAGTGTDPEEGAALAQAVLERLVETRSFVVATTHHRALTLFAHETNGVVNGAMEFDQESLNPTYRFIAGRPGSSFGLEIARRSGLPSGLLDRARTLLGKEHVRMDDLLGALQEETRQLSVRNDGLEAALAQAESERQRLQEQRRKLQRQLDEMKGEALREARDIVSQANARVERTIREIKEASAQAGATRATRERLASFRADVESELADLEERAESAVVTVSDAVGVGDHVVIDEGTTIGEIVEMRGSQAVVEMGSGRVRVAKKRLRKVQAQERTIGGYRRVDGGTVGNLLSAAGFRLDLRGCRADEAVSRVARFVDEAVVAGLNRVEVLHGRGTGALRKAIRDYLEEEDAVVGVEDAPIEGGGDGITVVNLSGRS